MSKEKMYVSDAKDLVCVTGANGFLGSFIVKELLERGYRVRGTVRSTKDPKKTQHLQALPGADKLLELVEADLSVENCFDDAFKDCKFVVHNASPFTFKYKDPKREMVDPAVNGTLSAMRSALKHHVTRIVVTSSINAITDQPLKRYTEQDWNTTSSYKRNAYHYSKVMAERAAWEFIDQHEQDPNCPELVTILPGGIIGAPLSVQGLENPSNEVLAQLFDGKIPGIINFGLSLVDVNDVALAHVLAMETPAAKGQRYICTNHTVSIKELAEHFRPKYPKAKIPTRDMSGKKMTKMLQFFLGFSGDPQNQFMHYMIGRVFDFDTSKIQTQLGIKFRDVWPELDQVAEMLIENNMVNSIKK